MQRRCALYRAFGSHPVTKSRGLPECKLQEAVLAEAVQAFRADFQEATRQASRLEAEVAAFFGRRRTRHRGGGGGDGAAVAEVGRLAVNGSPLGMRLP